MKFYTFKRLETKQTETGTLSDDEKKVKWDFNDTVLVSKMFVIRNWVEFILDTQKTF